MCLRVSSTAFSGASTLRTIRSRAAATLPVPAVCSRLGSRRPASRTGGSARSREPLRAEGPVRAIDAGTLSHEEARLDRGVVGQPQPPVLEAREHVQLPPLRATTAWAGPTISSPRARIWSIASGAVGPHSEAPSHRSSNTSLETGRTLKSPPSSSGAPPAQSSAISAARRGLPLGLARALRASGAGSRRTPRGRGRPGASAASRRRSRRRRSRTGSAAPTLPRRSATAAARASGSSHPPTSPSGRGCAPRARFAGRRVVARGERSVGRRLALLARAGPPTAAGTPGAGRRPSRRSDSTPANSSYSDRFTCTWVLLCAVVRNSTRAQLAQRADRAGSRGRGRGSTTARAAPGVRTGSPPVRHGDLSRRGSTSQRSACRSGAAELST